MADQKLSNKERLREITEGIEQGIKELFESDKYRQYLSTMSRFHRYSVNNTMLIYLQKPDATLVAGFNKWKDQFERHVKKGEHGITIIAPTPFKKKIEEQKLDPDTKAPVLDKDGRIVIEEKEVEIPMFRPVKVFDVSQTDGKPLPQLANNLSGDVKQFEAFMEALRRSSPVPIFMEQISADMDGYFSPTDQRIAIREGMSQAQTVSATVHEIAHSKLHNYEKERQTAAAGTEAEEVKPKDRRTEEVEAESISYAVCQYYGIQTGENSFGYIAAWSKDKELPELRASLETINKTAGGLIADVDRHFKDICKERGIDLAAQPEQEPTAVELAAAIDQLAFDYDPYEYKDQVDDREEAVRQLTGDILSGNVEDMKNFLSSVEAENENYTSAQKLLGQLDRLVPAPAERSIPEPEAGFHRYYITPESLEHGSYPFMVGGQIHESKELAEYEGGAVKAYGYIDYPQPLSAEQLWECALVPSADNPPEVSVNTGSLTYYVAECMEFPSLGEYHENLSLADAIRLYEAIPAERMNGIKGIGFDLQDNSDYAGQFPILSGRTIDLDSINSIDYFRNSQLVQKAVSELMAAMPDVEVLEPFAPVREEEGLFLVDGANYLHIQTSEEGYDYTIYDAATQKEVDGGCLSNPDLSLLEARKEIFAIHGMPAKTVEAADLDMLETLQEAQMAAMPRLRRYAMDENGEVRRTFGGKFPEEFDEDDIKQFIAENEAMLDFSPDTGQSPAAMLPDAPEQALDEYPMPDEDLKTEDLEQCGYLDGDLLPLSKDRAMELYEKDLTVYAVLDGGKSEMVFDREDFEAQPPAAMYAVSREEWEESPDFHAAVQDRMSHQEERESAFLSHEGDCFAIYQVKDSDELRDIRFEGLEWLNSIGRKVDRDNYDLAYTAPLAPSSQNGSVLDELYYQFNNEHPADYHRPSMSVSDIVVLKQAGAVSCHYVDSFGFADVPDFIKPENYLKNAEMSAEDDYGMIDGIINNGPKQTVAELEQQARSGQPISLMDLAEASHREQQEKKKSVMEQLKSQPPQETKKTAPKRSAEREI